jgi:hypothetical protein
MRTVGSHRKRRWVVVVLGAIVAVIGSAVTARATQSALQSSTTVCIKANGQLRVTTVENPVCVEPEAASEWTVNGVKEVILGTGLIGRNDGGIVQLEVDPGLIESASSGQIVAGFDDGPRDIPDELALVAQLPLQAGNYAIFAKLSLRNTSATALATVSCRLTAGGDFDEISTFLEHINSESAEGTIALSQSLEVVHRFDGPSRALLFCADSSFFFPDGEAVYENLKIIAIRGSSLSNTFIGD